MSEHSDFDTYEAWRAAFERENAWIFNPDFLKAALDLIAPMAFTHTVEPMAVEHRDTDAHA